MIFFLKTQVNMDFLSGGRVCRVPPALPAILLCACSRRYGFPQFLLSLQCVLSPALDRRPVHCQRLQGADLCGTLLRRNRPVLSSGLSENEHWPCSVPPIITAVSAALRRLRALTLISARILQLILTERAQCRERVEQLRCFNANQQGRRKSLEPNIEDNRSVHMAVYSSAIKIMNLGNGKRRKRWWLCQ